MNPPCRSGVAVLSNGLLGTRIVPAGGFLDNSFQVGFVRSCTNCRVGLSVRCAKQSRGQRPRPRPPPPAAVSVERESSTTGQLEKAKREENGAANSGTETSGNSVISHQTPRRGAANLSTVDGQTTSVHDYMNQVPFFLTDDGGPPRWFSPLIPAPPANSPLLLFLPGMDGTGLGLLLHHESLGRLFEVQCLHIPVHDRTPFTGLLKLVEDTVLAERERRPSGPIYLVGDSFGGALALSVAARNPTVDLSLILVNPATSFDRSQLQPLFPLLRATPSDFFSAVPFLLSFIMGDPIRMAEARVKKNSSSLQRALQLRSSLLSLLPTLPTLADVMPKEALLWKLKMLHSAALYTNSRLHAVRAEVLVLASGKDQMLPSVEEAKRLRKVIPGCRVRYFKNSGHTLLLEGGLNLSTVIKGAGCYRRGKSWDAVNDFVMPTREEFESAYDSAKLIRQLVSPIFVSTTQSGTVELGLSNIPTDRPVLFVGNHVFMGLDLSLVIGEVFKERNLLIRGLGHPVLFRKETESDLQEASMGDLCHLFGAVPVSGRTMFKLLKNGYSTLLYPGGAREALHRKGEAHKVFWPEQSEFVRMAARFGCTIIPLATVGEDDLIDILVDINDLRRIPNFSERFTNKDVVNIRRDLQGEVADQPFHFPLVAPKLNPGRLYIKFGKPIFTAGREKELQNKEEADVLYKHVKGEVERGLEYLQWKRQEDPYRAFLPRILYEQTVGGGLQAPTFKP